MPSSIFINLLNAEIEKFISYFSETSRRLFVDKDNKYFHLGEFGIYREKVAIPFLKMIIPQRLSIGSGFLITPKDNVSTQCDIIIYDSKSTPLIQGEKEQKFFPIETVVSIGEIKSILNRTEFKTAINKLAKNKQLRYDISNLAPNPIKRSHKGLFNLNNYPYDHIFSFLICEKLDFKFSTIDFDNLYDNDIDPIFRHNIILSIQDGVFTYSNGKAWPYPFQPDRSINLKSYLLKTSSKKDLKHFHLFAHYFFMSLDSASIYHPELKYYLY